MPVTPSTRQHLDDHLGQAEFALKVAANFDCLQGTPAHESVRVALARVTEARGWVRENISIASPGVRIPTPAYQSPKERTRIVHRRLARITP